MSLKYLICIGALALAASPWPTFDADATDLLAVDDAGLGPGVKGDAIVALRRGRETWRQHAIELEAATYPTATPKPSSASSWPSGRAPQAGSGTERTPTKSSPRCSPVQRSLRKSRLAPSFAVRASARGSRRQAPAASAAGQTRSGISTYWTSASIGSRTRAGSFGPPKRNSAISPAIWSVTSSR